MGKFFQGQVNKKGGGEMDIKKFLAIALLGVIIYVSSFGIGWALTIQEMTYSPIATATKIAEYDAAALDKVKITTLANGLQIKTTQANGDFITYQYNGSLLLSFKFSGTGDAPESLDYQQFFDATGQESYSIWLEVLVEKTVDGVKTKVAEKIANPLSTNVAIFLGDTGLDPVAYVGDNTIDTDVEKNEIALQNWAGTQLKDSGKLTITNANSDPHAGFNFALGAGPLFRTLSLDKNGDGKNEWNLTFGVTTNVWAVGPTLGSVQNPYVLYANGITKKADGGAAVGFKINGKTVGNVSRDVIVSGKVTDMVDPTAYHTDGHWDPAITVSGVLGQNTDGSFYVTSGGTKYSLEFDDENISAAFAANIGKTISVSGDVEEDGTQLALNTYVI